MAQVYLKGSNKDVLRKMQQAGFNVTTCGECGNIKLHETGIDYLECDYCDFKSDISDFPDLEVV